MTDEDVATVIEELRGQQATLRPVDDRGAEKGDLVAVSFRGTIDGEPFDGGTADRLPLILGEDRMIPGWEDQLVGLGSRKPGSSICRFRTTTASTRSPARPRTSARP